MLEDREIDLDALPQRLRPIFAAVPEVAAAYLFGSYARGHARPDSDLDVGVVYLQRDPGGTTHRRLAAGLAFEIGRTLRIEAVDVIDLEAQGPLFCHEALIEGRRLYEGDVDRRVDFESDAIIRGLDFRPTFDLATQGRTTAMRRWLRERP